MAAPSHPGLWCLLARGATRRCPRCGEGALFDGWMQLRDRCDRCSARPLDNPGDPWAFLLLLDRGAFLFPLVVALYFGLHRHHLALFVLFGTAVASFLIATTPHRYGLCVALDTWIRMRWGDLSSSPDTDPDRSAAAPAERAREEGGPFGTGAATPPTRSVTATAGAPPDPPPHRR